MINSKTSPVAYYSDSILNWLVVLLEERLGGGAFILFQQEDQLILRLSDFSGEISFDTFEPAFRQSRSNFPCARWDAHGEGWSPVLGQKLFAPGPNELPKPLISKNDTGYVVHYDILGLTYWMLSRLEEVGRSDLDSHGRFSSQSSHAFQHDYLERPIVDEWLDILSQVIKRQWPTISLKQHDFTMKVSHDLDNPSRYGFTSMNKFIRAVGEDVLIRFDVLNALKAPWIRFVPNSHLSGLDPYNTFDWLMDLSDKNDLTSAFYFICGRTDPKKDAGYEIENPPLCQNSCTIYPLLGGKGKCNANIFARTQNLCYEQAFAAGKPIGRIRCTT